MCNLFCLRGYNIILKHDEDLRYIILHGLKDEQIINYMAYKLSNFVCNRKIAPIIPNNSFTFREPSVIKAKKKKKKKKNNSSIKSHQFRKLNVSFPFFPRIYSMTPWLFLFSTHCQRRLITFCAMDIRVL